MSGVCLVGGLWLVVVPGVVVSRGDGGREVGAGLRVQR